MLYPINEIFHSLQGEGFYSGVPAIFIRFQGCSVGCQWCDTKYTWKQLSNKMGLLKDILLKSKVSNIWSYLDCMTVLSTIVQKEWNANHIVITGGEPSMHDLRPLTIFLEKNGFYCQLETSGTYAINCSEKTWVTVSPKLDLKSDNKTLMKSLIRSDEIKYLVNSELDIEILDKLLLNINDDKKRIISLQPISCNSIATNICIKNCLARNWKLSIQIHRYLNIR
ncbi:7-carboxy-7-deazaguanine synthase QueE [Candidatus Pantoea edessiphila]|uniref:7-carboxy-7-deazaguanine synthase n=1 Tax=Candidatus Pantoea edessiphila TaxID=2044610 RepID=A0A2P5SVN3_9GAMM|nr:7-carboxy-7-deazaguanine synthase QueE [Candidatus Pantoea edessiphila]PPI86394.1 7-carboxy-7-deazaguanine synthase QueE [Candidatus Pantoea edessiphila]